LIKLKTTGMKELTERLNLVGYETKYKSGRFALRKAAQLIAAALVDNAKLVDDPRTQNYIPRNVDIRWNAKRFRSNGELGFRVGIMGGAGGNANTQEFASNPGGDTRYWRFVEFGTRHSAPKPFFRKSMSDNAQAAIDEFIKQYRLSIDRALKRVGIT
jgi:HK97 gp10 family phage protein